MLVVVVVVVVVVVIVIVIALGHVFVGQVQGRSEAVDCCCVAGERGSFGKVRR